MKSFIALSALAALVYAQGTVPAEATQAEVSLVEQEYQNSGFDEALANSQSFDIPLLGQGLLTVAYGDLIIENGQDYPREQVADLPIVYFTPTPDHVANFTSTDTFTVVLADASAVGGPDPEGDYRHYLQNGASFGAAAGSDNATVTLNPEAGQAVTNYAGPGPLPDSGIHRYAWLLFQQGADFEAPANLSTAGVAPSHWILSEYVANSNLGALVGATFFTVTAEGTPTFSAGTTSSPVTSSAGPTSSSSNSQSSSQSSQPASSSPAPERSSDAVTLKQGLISLIAVTLAFAIFM